MENYNTFKQEDNVLIHTRLLNAPRELVWEVWTNPDHIKEWWGPDGFSLTTKSMHVEPGSNWQFVMHGMGQDWQNKIEYTEVIKPSLLTYRHTGERSDEYNFTVTILFEEHEGKTMLTMKSIFSSKEIIDELNRKVNAIEGGKQTLNRLTGYVEQLSKQ
ncbi:MAG: SRPBCC domain-containing protein [Flavitalea sp.]